MQRKLALLGLTLVAVALGLWFVLTYGTNAPTRVVEHASDPVVVQERSSVVAERANSDRANESPAAPGDSTRLRLRSSAGIPLAFAEIEHDGVWDRVALEGGACDARALRLPARLRAPGHVARRVESTEAEVELEPDALFLIEAQQLRSCLAEVQIEEDACARLDDWRAARELAVASGWISNVAYGIAVGCDRLQPLPRSLSFVVVRADRLRFYLEFVVRPGARATWEMPCAEQRACSGLDVRVERLPGARHRVQVELFCRAPPGTSTSDDVPWGSVSCSTAELDERLVLGENEDIAHFSQALVGRAHVVGALDESTHAYGSTSFVHDGRPQSIEMREALEIRGRVVEEQSRRPLRRVYLLFEGLGSPGWMLEAQQLELDARGGFSLRAPGRVPVNESMQLDPPELWTLSAEQPGYDARQFLRFERGGAPLLDVGEIALVRHKNPIALAAGHGLKAPELDGQGVVFADKPEELWKTVAGVALEDGRLEVEFSTSPVPGATPHGTRANLLDGEEQYVSFDRALGTILFVNVVDDVRSFRLESDGLYHPLPEDSLELTLRTETRAPEDKPWRIGWTWDGAWIEVGQLAPREPGNEAKARITVPHGAQQIWWSSSGIPPDLHGDPGGFQAITGSSMKVVLR